jgi:hypothetical protein
VQDWLWFEGAELSFGSTGSNAASSHQPECLSQFGKRRALDGKQIEARGKNGAGAKVRATRPAENERAWGVPVTTRSPIPSRLE